MRKKIKNSDDIELVNAAGGAYVPKSELDEANEKLKNAETGSVNGVSGNVDMNIIENTSIIEDSGTIPTTDIPDTATVQRWLNKVYNNDLVVDNIYGIKTRTAIIKGFFRATKKTRYLSSHNARTSPLVRL